MTLTSIFAAVGQFPQDDPVLARAVEVAATHRAALTIVHVIDLPGLPGDLGERDSLQGQTAVAARDRIEAALSLARQGASAPDMIIQIEAGSPALKLIEICEETKPDLIVMRGHQKSRIIERILGSTTDRMISTGIAPVLVVKRPAHQRYADALVATNGTDDATGALSFVEALLPCANLHLVQVVQISPQLKEAMLRGGTDQATIAAHRVALTKEAQDHLRELCANTSRRVTRRVLRGDPVDALVRATRSPKVDLIALGPGRNSLIRRAFIGSVTRRLLRDAACDVLICHPTHARA